jgi:hypothetical protein
VLKIYPANNQKTAVQFLDYGLPRLPFGVDVIQTENGAEFQSAFHWRVIDKGIQHVYIKPRTPRLNGKVELVQHPQGPLAARCQRPTRSPADHHGQRWDERRTVGA